MKLVAYVGRGLGSKHSNSKFGTFAFIYLNSPINSSKRLVYLHQPTKKLMTKLKTVVYVVML